MSLKAHVFDIKRNCSEDGPGIRTTVFFKGCPLSCIWCQNPEGNTDRELSFSINKCIADACGIPCVSVCETDCLSYDEKLIVDYDKCTRCDKCFEVCPTKALEPVGYWITLDELLYRVLIDEVIFKSSGGGVTLSGGEATQQMEFSSEFLQALKAKNIHTALETSGFFNYRKFSQQLLPYLDLILYDLKIMDDDISRKYTGQSNQLILQNFECLIEQGDVEIVPRIPLIPGITATQENLQQIARYLKRFNLSNVELLPYNPLWIDKIQRLGLTPRYERQKFMSAEEKSKSYSIFYSAIKQQVSPSH